MLSIRAFTLFIFLCFYALTQFAQNTKLVLTKVKLGGKQDAFNIYEVHFKVISGNVGDTRVDVCLLKDGQIKSYGYVEVWDKLGAGQSTKSAQTLYIVGTDVKEGMTLISYDLIPSTLPANRTFSFKTQQAFLGNEPNEFFASIENLKGTLKVGDAIEYVNFKGERSRGKITELQVERMKPPILIDGLPAEASQSVSIVSDTKADFTKATVASIGSLGNTPIATTKTTEKSNNSKTKTILINAVLENNEVKITVHNLVKFNPDPTDNQYDIMKVDYGLDYYIVDATIENKTAQPIDAGEYMLRLNFFDKNGKSADEFLRTFKNDGSHDDTKQKADKVDVNIFGGTSKIRLSQVMVKYQALFPDYDTKYKPNVEAIMKNIAPKQKIRSEMATLMGVPPSYKIEGIGTWNGTFFNKKNLLFTPMKL